MPHPLPELETQRAEMVRQMAHLGDLRAGSITGTTGRCGKSNCHCHQPKEAGHGPNVRLTYKVQGKTVTESLPSPAAVRKAEAEIAEFRKFQQLQRDFVEINTTICRLRPVPEQSTPQEKKRRQPSSRKSRAK